MHGLLFGSGGAVHSLWFETYLIRRRSWACPSRAFGFDEVDREVEVNVLNDEALLSPSSEGVDVGNDAKRPDLFHEPIRSRRGV